MRENKRVWQKVRQKVSSSRSGSTRDNSEERESTSENKGARRKDARSFGENKRGLTSWASSFAIASTRVDSVFFYSKHKQGKAR